MNGALLAEFPPVSTADWEAAIVKDLKGGDPKKLAWKTEDGFEVKPFYRMEDAPGLPPFSDFPKRWRICAEVDGYDSAVEAMARGAQAVLVRPKDGAELQAVLERLPLDRVEVHVRGGIQTGASFRGSADTEPRPSGTGLLYAIDGDRFAALEPTATQELALMLAVGSEYLATAGAAIANQLAFDFPIGGNYFFEVAKLRAARLLWPRVVAAYTQSLRPAVRIYAHTGEWNKTIYDPYVNMLRATTEAMSAVIGGAELVTVTAFNSAFASADDFSRRMAVNTQLILREEAHFDELSDPAAGCWYLESLTDRIAEQAWRIFQAIEAAGGYAKAGDLIAEIVRPARENRRALIGQRRKLFTGINTHANPKERELENITRRSEAPRGPEPFEQLRVTAEKYEEATGRTPRVFLLRYGDPKMRRARAEFSADFFACGGFDIINPPAFASLADAATAIAAEKPDLVVLCSSDPEYPALAEAVCPKLSCPVIVAGYPKEDIARLKEAGVADFVHIRSNALETLAAWQQKLGIRG